MMAIIIIGCCWAVGIATVFAALAVSGQHSQAEHQANQRRANLKVISGGIGAAPFDHTA